MRRSGPRQSFLTTYTSASDELFDFQIILDRVHTLSAPRGARRLHGYTRPPASYPWRIARSHLFPIPTAFFSVRRHRRDSLFLFFRGESGNRLDSLVCPGD